MPTGYYFRPVQSGLGELGARLGSGIERGVEGFETMRSRRRQERRQTVEDERRHRFEDSAERRAQAAEGRMSATHPYDLERLRLGLDAGRVDLERASTSLALTGRDLGGGRYTEGMDLPEGTQRYGGVYGLTPEAERQQGFDRMKPTLSLLSNALGRDITPEMAEGGERLGLNVMQLADPTNRTGYNRELELIRARAEDDRELQDARDEAALARVEHQQQQAAMRQREGMWPAIKLDTFGGFDQQNAFTGWRADPETMAAAERHYIETGEMPRELANPQQAQPGPSMPTGLSARDVEEAIPALFGQKPKNQADARRILKRAKYTDDQIEYILDVFEDFVNREAARAMPNAGRERR